LSGSGVCVKWKAVISEHVIHMMRVEIMNYVISVCVCMGVYVGVCVCVCGARTIVPGPTERERRAGLGLNVKFPPITTRGDRALLDF
jgi:hypothetical protein